MGWLNYRSSDFQPNQLVQLALKDDVCGVIVLFVLFHCGVNIGSYMSAHVLLNLLKTSLGSDKMQGLPSILSLFRNKFNKFNNTRA